jgi:protein-S-isoprenylcysteine O-methyltransferase Ste14
MMDISVPNLTLFLSLCTTTYLSYRAFRPPNPAPKKPHHTDRLRIAANIDTISIRRIVALALWLFHLILLLFPAQRSPASSLCLNPELLNENLFTWSPVSMAYVATVLIFAPIRLLAYRQLGKNFTFQLAAPSKLTTTGLYHYVQHPSYTTLMGVSIAWVFFSLRSDGVAACIMPGRFWGWIVGMKWLNEIWGSGMVFITSIGLWMRVKDEEAMLKGEFGKEWEVWHAKTKRFIPGII